MWQAYDVASHLPQNIVGREFLTPFFIKNNPFLYPHFKDFGQALSSALFVALFL